MTVVVKNLNLPMLNGMNTQGRYAADEIKFPSKLGVNRPPDKRAYWKTIFLISQPKHM